MLEMYLKIFFILKSFKIRLFLNFFLIWHQFIFCGFWPHYFAGGPFLWSCFSLPPERFL